MQRHDSSDSDPENDAISSHKAYLLSRYTHAHTRAHAHTYIRTLIPTHAHTHAHAHTLTEFGFQID